MRTKTKPARSPRFLCKVSRRNLLHRLIWWGFRRYLLNEDHYRLVTRFTGPRPYSRHSTRRQDATAHRYYLEARPRSATAEQQQRLWQRAYRAPIRSVS